MEASLEKSYQAENDEEYVLLDLENVCLQADIPANAPYTLSGLDTLNPTLTIGSRLKLIGEYEETVGTCILFSQRAQMRKPDTLLVFTKFLSSDWRLKSRVKMPRDFVQHVITALCNIIYYLEDYYYFLFLYEEY
ncbi:uncharacterized protein LOC110032992 isoform X1 [Phalaenopsis equestris]|uniref:uncharacterized protein LOC110032992 isoform X1 n=1 Tax=Phalaenopsis equestris TaxID=78828 RepID=UPI0009E2EA05|nr:uncharacterized protein LOC110032992 isoform X1 [Phalaenopsis equestris]